MDFDFAFMAFDFSDFFTTILSVNIFPRTLLPVGISMYVVTNRRKLEKIGASPGMSAYLFLQWGFLGIGTPTYFYRGHRQMQEIGPKHSVPT